jgi:hypothetical protein
MKKYILGTLATLILLGFGAVLYASDPVTNVSCTSGGEFGNVITLNFDRAFAYKTLTIKRSNPNSDYQKNLSVFNGGTYRLDLASRGGVKGFSVEYCAKDDSCETPQTAEGELNCR